MQPAQQQAQPEVLAMQRRVSRQPAQLPHSQGVGCCRWAAAIISTLVLASLAVVMVFLGHEQAFEQMLPEDPNIDPSPADILRHQFWDYHPKVQRFALHTSLGQVLLSQGRLSEAGVHFKEALELAESKAEQVEARRLLGLAQLRQGHLEHAKELLEAALGFLEQETDVTVLHALGGVRAEMGHFEQALKLYNQAFGLAERRRDVDKAALLATDIGEAWMHKGNVEESFDWLRTADRVLSDGRLLPAGVDEAVVAKVETLRGSLLHLSGGILPATELYRTALRKQARVLHPSHPDIVSTRLQLIRAQRDLGDVEGALRDIEAVEATLRGESPGPDLSRVLIYKSNLLRESSNLAAATETIQEVIRLQATLFQEDHPDVAVALGTYGSILHDAGMATEAQEKYTKALTISLRTLGEKHPGTASVYNSLGTLHEDLGDDGKAREHFSKCLDIQLETLGKDSPDVANTYNNLATVLFRQGRSPEAAELLKHALHVLDIAGVPQDNPDRLLYQENLGLVRAKTETKSGAGFVEL